MVDVTADIESSDDGKALAAAVKLQAETWELNVRAPAADFTALAEIRRADWDARRSIAVGRCAEATVYWTCHDGQATILVGHDDETWDVAVTVPVDTIDQIVWLVSQLRNRLP